MTLPGPVRVVRNSPSPPKNIVFIPFTRSISYETVPSQPTTQPVSTFNRCPGWRSNSMKSPQAWMNAVPSPASRSRIKPSPPKKTDPSRRWNVTLSSTPSSAQRNASFCTMNSLPEESSIGLIVPGALPPNATSPLPPSGVNSVRNMVSPANLRPIALSNPPRSFASIPIFALIYTIAPASPYTRSPSFSSIVTS